MVLETDRLQLIPLTPEQLRLWIEDMPALEKALDCSYRGEPLEGTFLDIVKWQLTKTKNDSANYLYHSFWFLVSKFDRTAVGCADFKDIPNKIGEVEIGYGLGKEFEHSGYMTEAVKAMCGWAMTQDGVSHVIAQTDTDNPQSQNVLKHCGFTPYKQEETIWWRL